MLLERLSLLFFISEIFDPIDRQKRLKINLLLLKQSPLFQQPKRSYSSVPEES